MANRFPNKFLTRLRMTKPIIQAPMTGFVTEEMVVAVSNAPAALDPFLRPCCRPMPLASRSRGFAKGLEGQLPSIFSPTPPSPQILIAMSRGGHGSHRSSTNLGLSKTCGLH
jgi:hypothetical protein